MMGRFLCSFLALGLLQGVAGEVKAQPTYSFTTFDVLRSSMINTKPNGINASGQILGSYSDAPGIHGFLLDNGSYTKLDVPGSTHTEAYGINAAGQIVGHYKDASGNG